MLDINQKYLQEHRNPLLLTLYHSCRPLISKTEINSVCSDGKTNPESFDAVSALILSKIEKSPSFLTNEMLQLEQKLQKEVLLKLKSLFLSFYNLQTINAEENFRDLLDELEKIEPEIDIIFLGKHLLEKMTLCFIMLFLIQYEPWIKIYKSVKNQTKLSVLSCLKRK